MAQPQMMAADNQAGAAPPASGISPYLLMQAKKEMDSGKPGEAMAQLGNHALATGAIHPAEAAFHAERMGALPPGSTQAVAQRTLASAPAQMPPGGASPQPNPVAPSPANPAGAAGSMVGDENQGQVGGPAGALQKPDAMAALKTMASPVDPQQKALQDFRDKVAQAQAPTQNKKGPDLTGLMMAADFANGTDHFTKGYQAQQAGERDEAKTEQQKQLSLLGEQAKGINPFHVNQNGEYDKFFTGLQGDHLLSDAAKAKSDFESAQQLVNQNNNISALMAKGDLLHRAFGRVNQTEYAQAGGDSGVANTVSRLWNKMNIFASQNPGADMAQAFTPTDQQEFRNAINVLASQANKTLNQRLELHKQDAMSKGVDAGRYTGPLNAIKPGFIGDPSAPQAAAPMQAPAPAAAPPPPHAPQFEPDVMAYAQKHGISPMQAKQIKMQRTSGGG